VLAARIDRLAPEDKRLLQAAAVVGVDVPWPLLLAVAEGDEETVRAGLARLQAAQFLYEAQIFPELELSFLHALTHEVAYGSLLSDRRVSLHAALVPAHERLYGDRAGEHVERLAHHATRGQLWDQAVTYGHAAGSRCLARSAYRAAAAFLEDALAAAEQLPPDRHELARAIDLRVLLRSALFGVGEPFRAFGRLVEAEELAVKLADRGRIAVVTSRLMQMLWLVGQTEQARAYERRALEHAEAVGDPVPAISLYYTIATAAIFWADYASVERHAGRMLELLAGDHAAARGDGLMFPSVGARILQCSAYAEQGRFAEALEVGEEALRLAEALRHPFGVAQTLMFLAFTQMHRGDYAACAAIGRRCLALADEATALASFMPYLRGFLAFARIQDGKVDEGVRELRAAVEDQVALKARAGLSLIVGLLAEGLLAAGRLAEARVEAERGLEIASSCGERRMEATFGWVLGGVAARSEPPAVEEAEARYVGALAVATDLGARPSAAHCHLGLGELYRRAGQAERAREHLATAAAMYREMGMASWLARALAP